MRGWKRYIVFLIFLPATAWAQKGYLGKTMSVGYSVYTRPQVYPSAVSDLFTGDVSLTWDFRHELEFGYILAPQIKLEGGFLIESSDYTPRDVSGVQNGLNITGVAGKVGLQGFGGRLGAKFYIKELGALAPIGWYFGLEAVYIDYQLNTDDARFRVKNPNGSNSLIRINNVVTKFDEFTLGTTMGYSRVFFDRFVLDAGLVLRFPLMWATERSVRDATVDVAWIKSHRERIALLNSFHARTSLSYLF